MRDLAPRLDFSYGQFYVHDENVALPGCLWTETHSAQGFARRESVVSFGTLIQSGLADVRVEFAAFAMDDSYERVIGVPFEVITGRVVVEGPEEMQTGRIVQVPAGHYRLFAAQRVLGENKEAIKLFFEKLDQPVIHSIVLLADDDLRIPNSLLESADIA